MRISLQLTPACWSGADRSDRSPRSCMQETFGLASEQTHASAKPWAVRINCTRKSLFREIGKHSYMRQI